MTYAMGVNGAIPPASLPHAVFDANVVFATGRSRLVIG